MPPLAFKTTGMIGSPTGAGPPALRIPAYLKVEPFERFLLVFISRTVGSNLDEWQIQNNFVPPSSPPPGLHESSVNELETNCQPGIQHKCVHRPKIITKFSEGSNRGSASLKSSKWPMVFPVSSTPSVNWNRAFPFETGVFAYLEWVT